MSVEVGDGDGVTVGVDVDVLVGVAVSVLIGVEVAVGEGLTGVVGLGAEVGVRVLEGAGEEDGVSTLSAPCCTTCATPTRIASSP